MSRSAGTPSPDNDLAAAAPPGQEAPAAPTPPPTLADARAEGRRLLERIRQNRAKLQILAIGGVALGGIVCMALATLVIVWRLINP